PTTVELYPEDDAAPRQVMDLMFMQRLTLPDNFVLRPDEFAGVTTDHKRGVLYVGSREGTLFALDGNDGSVAWEIPISGSISSIPVFAEDDNVLVFGTDNGALVALDLETRAPRWSYETPGTIRNQPLIHGEIVYFANSRDQIYALDLATGDWRWQYPADESLFQTNFTVHGRSGLSLLELGDGVSSDGVVFSGFDDGRVVALGANSGVPLWTTSVAPPERGDFVDADGTPLVDANAGELVVSGASTGVYGLSIDDGSQRWHKPVKGAGSVIAGPGGVLVFTSSLEGIFGIERGGRERWRQQVDPGVLSTPVIVDDLVFVTHSDTGLLTLDARTGEFLARLDTGSGVSSVPSYDPVTQRFYAVTNRGDLLAFAVR
ncbi:MAG: PQQ-binding-like beta-propeller repeat protein, partial [Myxococcales bacterium]|nr:PQQ-binding-like beta-propeller repeat protein [Myxococcales bacterium]